ncbi:dynein heavy chain, axonemal [Paragonimus westermani]|uniref:Dynein heavy chain, axonemal n=1 Tax=Paragonimus westermani TaxID=34504 RepID=A0A5J4NVV0_9TREM|nr:dynein heavy chain, axonemal [Paragonimus westermani]
MDVESLMQLSKHSEIIYHLEESVSQWMRQIDEEAKEVEMLRVEREQNGPHEEFDFWKCRMTRMNSLVRELRRTDIQNVILALQSVRSKAIEKWVDLDKKVTNAYNEAKENVRFLSTVEKLCMLLNHTNLITNQIIATCKRYLTNKNKKSIWEQDSDLIIQRMNECIELNLAYQEAYRTTRQEMIDSGAKQAFNFSEVQIFGNMNLFTQRLEYLTRVLQTLGQYATLREFVLEGKEPLIVKLDRLHTIITSKRYDYLDQRNQQFVVDYEDFKNRIAELHASLLTTIGAYFRKPCGLTAQIKLQERLETLKIPELNHKERYRVICNRLKDELLAVARLFQSGVSDPPLYRNMPPFAGRIAWARCLYRRLEAPMNALAKRATKILLTEEGQKLIALYNDTVGNLVGYEITVYQTWNKMLMCNEYVRITKLIPPHLTLLVAPTVQLINTALRPGITLYNWTSVSLKPYTDSVFKELYRLERTLDQANQIFENRISDVLKRIANCQLLSLPADRDSPLEMIDLIYQTKQQTKKVSEEIDTLSLSAFCAAIEYINRLLVDYDVFVERNKLSTKVEEEMRLKRTLMDSTSLETKTSRKPIVTVPGSSSKGSPEDMNTDKPNRSGRAPITSGAGQSVYDGSKTPTNATDWQAQAESQAGGLSLRTMVVHSQNVKTALQIANAADDLMFSLGQRTIDAVCQSVRTALDRLWNILATREAAVALKDVPVGKPVKCGSARPFPLVRCYIRVIGHTLDVWPRPNDIQYALKVIVNTVETSTKGILAWGREGRCKTLPIMARRSSVEDEAFRRVRGRGPKRPQSTSHSPSCKAT